MALNSSSEALLRYYFRVCLPLLLVGVFFLHFSDVFGRVRETVWAVEGRQWVEILPFVHLLNYFCQIRVQLCFPECSFLKKCFSKGLILP